MAKTGGEKVDVESGESMGSKREFSTPEKKETLRTLSTLILYKLFGKGRGWKGDNEH